MLPLASLAVVAAAAARARPGGAADAPAAAAMMWPLPRSVAPASGGATGALGPSFAFKATGAASDTLTQAFERYAKLMPSGGAAASGTGTALAGLDVSVSSASLALGIATSEAYNLTVAFPRATLSADTVYGALRGLETFSQLVGADRTIAAQTIADYPRFPHRGVMLVRLKAGPVLCAPDPCLAAWLPASRACGVHPLQPVPPLAVRL